MRRSLIDVLATNQDATRSVTIQCKTNQRGEKVWILNEKCEEFFAEDHYYVFVALSAATLRPSFHIVPSKIVAKVTAESHRQWRGALGKRGQQHRDSSIRKFADSENTYLDRWDLLGL